ncbi:MAG: lysine--tRNA ligase [Candidatus Pacebacteria bacterium]|nr:lysine--tRNA ligase [Candidatus Paceibacterota bacterium]
MSRFDEIRSERLRKIKELRELNINPYPEKSNRTHKIIDIKSNFSNFLNSQESINISGRIMSLRKMGSLNFLNLKDESDNIQVVIQKDSLSEDKFNIFKKYFDIGDFVQISGTAFKTKTDEPSIFLTDFLILSKSLSPLPSEFYGLSDEEEKIRKRYLDLIMNSEVKKNFDMRFKIIKLTRDFLAENGFIEVETPIIQPQYGGALAKPFKTHLNALDMDAYLRIAPELYLKRLLVGGYEKIFEIGKCFRNEGIDREHNPEFTMLELYQAYASKEDLMKLLEDLVKYLCDKLNINLNFKYPFPKITFNQFIFDKSQLDFDKDDISKFVDFLKSKNVEVEDNVSKGKLADEIIKLYRNELKDPVFLINHPLEISPLAKEYCEDNTKASRFHLLINGMEISNGFSELNDPVEQRKRLEQQQKELSQGDSEAHPLDESFIEAIEYGMPQAAGLGIGIARIISVFTQTSSIKDVLPFPFIKNN